MNKTELNKILNLHKLWLNDDPKGRRADLTDAILTNATLTNADLTSAILTNATLTNADLRNADLTNATLTNADLRNAILSGAILSGAYLSGADLSDADLSGAILSGAILSGATFNKETVFPKGFDPIARGMKLIEEKVLEAPSPTKQEETVAAGTAVPKTLREELVEVLGKHGLVLGKNCLFQLI